MTYIIALICPLDKSRIETSFSSNFTTTGRPDSPYPFKLTYKSHCLSVAGSLSQLASTERLNRSARVMLMKLTWLIPLEGAPLPIRSVDESFRQRVGPGNHHRRRDLDFVGVLGLGLPWFPSYNVLLALLPDLNSAFPYFNRPCMSSRLTEQSQFLYLVVASDLSSAKC